MALATGGKKYTINAADGAFYGPKIDITVVDSLRRRHQCATVQLDFQLPQRFNLSFSSADSSDAHHRPVLIHRAILGSVERFMALLTEHNGGKWPLWLSPRQVAVVPVGVDQLQYALDLVQQMKEEGIEARADVSSNTLNKKIRSAQVSQYNYILVVGKEEVLQSTVNLRSRDNVVHGEIKMDVLLARLKDEMAHFL